MGRKRQRRRTTRHGAANTRASVGCYAVSRVPRVRSLFLGCLLGCSFLLRVCLRCLLVFSMPQRDVFLFPALKSTECRRVKENRKLSPSSPFTSALSVAPPLPLLSSWHEIQSFPPPLHHHPLSPPLIPDLETFTTRATRLAAFPWHSTAFRTTAPRLSAAPRICW